MNKLAKLGKWGIVLIVLAILIIFLPQIAHFSTDYLWFSELGYQSVFLKFTFAKFIVGFVVFLLVFLLTYFTLHVTTKYVPGEWGPGNPEYWTISGKTIPVRYTWPTRWPTG